MAKKRQTFGKMQRERERAEKRERKREKRDEKKANVEAGLVFDTETGEWSDPNPSSPDGLAAPEEEPETGVTPPGEVRT